MKRVEFVKPNEVETCDATRTEKYCNDKPGIVNKCKKPSKWKIDGSFLCGQHAGQAALSILMEIDQ